MTVSRLPAFPAFMAIVAGCTMVAATYAQEAPREVDLELVLLADASRSIDDAEARFQRQGYAEAIVDPRVLSAIAGGGAYGRIAVTYVEWADQFSQDVVVDWTIIDGEESARRFAAALQESPRRAYGRNAIGTAIAAGHRLIEENDIAGHRKVIDLSGDSANNWNGIPIAIARQAAIDAGIVINGLAILCRRCSGRPNAYDLERAYAETIIGGPGSFVVTADSMATFATAVRQKLLLEIAGHTPRGQRAVTVRPSSAWSGGRRANVKPL